MCRNPLIAAVISVDGTVGPLKMNECVTENEVLIVSHLLTKEGN